MLKAEGISVVRDGITILNDVNFTIDKGEIALIIGPNGSGKSTLFKAIMGLIEYRGRIVLDDEDITRKKPHERFRKGIVMAPERMRCALDLTVEENIEISGKFEDAVKIFPELKKLKNRKVEKLSGGERQMVVFSRALISNPKYLLLDEPFQGVSDEICNRMVEEINKRRKSTGITIISHDKIEEIAEISNKIYLMVAGKIRKEFSGDEVKKLEKYIVI